MFKAKTYIHLNVLIFMSNKFLYRIPLNKAVGDHHFN